MVARKYFPMPCRICGTVFTPVNKGQTMCSRKCAGISISGENHYLYGTGKWGAGRYKDNKGYITTHVKGVKNREHRVIAEKALGRPLPKGAMVHHVDGDRTNNSHDNLVICQDSSYHKLLHANREILDAGGQIGSHLICGGCKKALPLESFAVNRRNVSRYGRNWECRACNSIRCGWGGKT
jgi:hypothetical protein